MEVYPSHIGDTLGFGVIQARIIGSCTSESGAALGSTLAPLPFEQARDELAFVTEMLRLQQAGHSLPEALFDPVDDYIAEVRPRGAFLDPDALLEIRRLCRSSSDVRRFLESGETGLMNRAAQRIAPLDGLGEAIRDLLEDDGEIKESASSELRRIRREIRSAQAHVRKSLMSALRKATSAGWATEDQPTLRGGRMVIPVRAEAKRKVSGIVHDMSATGQTAFIEPAQCVELNNDVRELEAEERREIVRLLTVVSALVRENAVGLLANQRELGLFDIRRAKALLAASYDGVAPSQADEGIIDLLEARNPELVLHLGDAGRTVVPLSVKLGSEATMLVISGPNAGGKSVAMKTIGLCAWLLACGIPIPAAPESRFDRFDRMLADIGDEQSVEDDLSTFSSRLTRTREMVERADPRTLVLIDEAGTGTDPQEGAALAQAALEVLHAAKARVVVTTHHAALKLFAHETPGAVNAMMRFDEESLSPTYQFEEGLPGASYAFEIADRMGLPPEVVARGRAILGSDHVSMERLLGELEARNRSLEEEVVRQSSEAGKAAEKRRILQRRLEALTDARDQIKDRALEEAHQILGGANAEVERAIREIRESQADRGAVLDVRKRLEKRKSSVGQARTKTRRKKKSRSAPPVPTIQGPIGIGDHVRVGVDGPTGEIIKLKGNEAVVAIGPAHTRVKMDRLSKLGGPREQRVSVTSSVSVVHARLTLDVRGKRALEAVSEVERFVDEALSGGLNRAEILHGKGTGALRLSIHDYLATRSDLSSFAEAPIEQGGAGVTIVQI
ncbi:MAG: DNA mismatch repair protein MutS2 [Rhodothermales bacterium]|jgi:DNA mismatch repair protein MutS2